MDKPSVYQPSLWGKYLPEAGSSLVKPSPTSVTYKPLPKWESAGCVVVRALDPETIAHVLMILPANFYNGGKWTFPKGRVDAGETHMVAAMRETAEETGRYAVLFPRAYLGKGEGTSSITSYYLAIDAGETGKGPDKETQSIMWTHIDDAIAYLESINAKRDLMIAKLARKRIRRAQMMLRFQESTRGI
jgi:8-oxo-dGTP pyrophosphatase MutT (NUDIX family)